MTHLINLIKTSDPERFGIRKIIIWINAPCSVNLPNFEWLEVKCPAALSRSLISRLFWRFFIFKKELKLNSVDLLLAPGGLLLFSSVPTVVMCRNMLPLEISEARRYGFSWMWIRLMILRVFQLYSFKNAEGVIFVSEHARNVVQSRIGIISNSRLIRHGVVSRICKLYREVDRRKINLIYVSTIDVYKHHDNVLKAVFLLRQKGYDIELIIVGGSYDPSLDKLKKLLRDLGSPVDWVHLKGFLTPEQIESELIRSDVAIFASSCENMPNILVEKMAHGLVVLCSRIAPITELFRNELLLFDPEDVDEIAQRLNWLLSQPVEDWQVFGKSNLRQVNGLSWEACANDTLDFLRKVAIDKQR